MGDEMNYSGLDSLVPLEDLLDEAVEALRDTDRTILTSGMPDVLGAAVGMSTVAGIGAAAAGITTGIAALGAIVGGGMLAGLAVVAAPAVLLGGIGYAAVSRYNGNELAERKEMLLQEVLRRHDAIINALHYEVDANEDRLDYLHALNIQLQSAIADLESDLAA